MSHQGYLKGVSWVHIDKMGLERSQRGYNDKIGYTLIKVGTQCKNQVIWS